MSDDDLRGQWEAHPEWHDQENRAAREATLPALLALIGEFRTGALDLTEFRRRIDSQSKQTESGVWGFRGNAGVMFFTMLWKGAPAEFAPLLQSVINVPADEAAAKNAIDRVRELARTTKARTGNRNLHEAFAPFFLSFLWEAQDRDSWPIYHPASREGLERFGLVTFLTMPRRRMSHSATRCSRPAKPSVSTSGTRSCSSGARSRPRQPLPALRSIPPRQPRRRRASIFMHLSRRLDLRSRRPWSPRSYSAAAGREPPLRRRRPRRPWPRRVRASRAAGSTGSTRETSSPATLLAAMHSRSRSIGWRKAGGSSRERTFHAARRSARAARHRSTARGAPAHEALDRRGLRATRGDPVAEARPPQALHRLRRRGDAADAARRGPRPLAVYGATRHHATACVSRPRPCDAPRSDPSRTRAAAPAVAPRCRSTPG